MSPKRLLGQPGSLFCLAPLRILGQKLGLHVHNIPKERGAFKTWTVRPSCLYLISILWLLQLPDPFVFSPDGASNQPPANHILVTASFGRILTAKMLSSFQPSHRLNVHPSLLPAYRGPAPIQHTIMNGDRETGVCVIQMLKMREGIDAGAVFGHKKMV